MAAEVSTTDRLRRLAWIAHCEGTFRFPAREDFDAGWDALAAILGHDHYVTYTRDGFTVEHSLECRLAGSMAGCEYHRLAALGSGDLLVLNGQEMFGRYRIDGSDEAGLVVLTSAPS